MNEWFLYILRCRDGSLYTGITTDTNRRLDQHNSGKASRYTRSRLPVKLVYTEKHACESAARKREHAVKRWKRSKKEELIRGASFGS